ncbi:MAG: GNAT family N-acetyltransferase [Flaviflexus sp.]|nr:GNAT family N-acetyltransferase [Flaviflexus sp.]
MIELVTETSDELVEAMNRLLPQLSSSAKELDEKQVRALVDQPNLYLFIYRHDGVIRGMLSLATFAIPTGLRAWIEDVVVEVEARGHGAGQALVEAACAHGTKIGAKSIDLTSRPSREAANRLYRRCGFEKRETNVYRYAG